MKGFFEFDKWNVWFHQLEAVWLFLLILALVIVVVGFWSRNLRTDKNKELEKD